MMGLARHVAVFSAIAIFSCARLSAQTPFQLPTANQSLYKIGDELKYFALTTPEKPWTSGSFGCVRNDGWRMHEGLDILRLQTDRRGEPTDPVLATADGTVAYFNKQAGLSDYGNYLILRHVIEGVEIYSLYAHLSEIRSSLKIGAGVKAGEVIGTMGRTSSAGVITKNRAHLHFELNLLLNEKFSAWFKKTSPGERNDHGGWSGLNLLGLDPREIFIAQRHPVKSFSLLTYLRGQTELCRVQVRATNFSYLKRYPGLVLKNPVSEKSGVAGYELVLNFNGVPFALLPRAASEMKNRAKIQLISVNEPVANANPCRKLVVKRGNRWELGDAGVRELELLVY